MDHDAYRAEIERRMNELASVSYFIQPPIAFWKARIGLALWAVRGAHAFVIQGTKDGMCGVIKVDWPDSEIIDIDIKVS